MLKFQNPDNPEEEIIVLPITEATRNSIHTDEDDTTIEEIVEQIQSTQKQGTTELEKPEDGL